MDTVGEQLKAGLIREGFALFMTLREQVTQPAPQNRLVIRPSVPSGVRAWWLTTASPLFSYFADWIKVGPLENVASWTIRLAQLRKEAARLGLLVLPSAFFDAVDSTYAA
jgi:hypothetical protein